MLASINIFVLTIVGLASAIPQGVPSQNGSSIPFPYLNNTVPLLPNGTVPDGTFPNGTLPIVNGTLPSPGNGTNVTLPIGGN